MEMSEKELAELLDSLPEWRRAEAMKFKFTAGKKECAMSFALLRDMLQEHFGVELKAEFHKNEHGKPYIPAEMCNGKELHFNISHCKKAIACAVSDSGAVGIDVECMGRYKPSLAEYCMSEEELKMIAEAEEADEVFTSLWTKKEALLKYTGEGITDDMKTCLNSHRTKDACITSGCNKERGYAWSVVRGKV